MKKTTKLFIFAVLLSAVLIGLGFILGGSYSKINSNKDYTLKTIEISNDDSRLKLTTNYENVEVYQSKTTNSYIEYYDHNTRSDFNLSTIFQEVIVNIGTARNTQFPWISYKYPTKEIKTVKVYIHETTRTLEINAKHGNVTATDVTFGDKIIVNTNIGNITLKNVGTINSIQLNTKLDGEINVSNVRTFKLDLNSKLGKITLIDNNSFQSIIKTTFGSINIKDGRAREDIAFTTNIKFRLTKINLFGIKYKSLNDENPEDELISYNISTTSGKIKVTTVYELL